MAMTNTLAYYDVATIMTVNIFIVKGQVFFIYKVLNINITDS
jgi:hypothetical protein